MNIWEFIKERTKNPFSESVKTPFIGTFIIALILYNWEIIFSIFYFDLSYNPWNN